MTTVDEARSIMGFPGYYASPEGDIFSTRRGGWRKMKPASDRDGYQVLTLRADGAKFVRPVHLLVLAAFAGPKPTPKHVGRHLNGNHCDNRAANLRWGTSAENAQDTERHGRASWSPRFGENALCVKLTEEQVLDIDLRSRAGESARSLAVEFEVTPKTIYNIRTRKCWRHLWPA